MKCGLTMFHYRFYTKFYGLLTNIDSTNKIKSNRFPEHSEEQVRALTNALYYNE